MKLSRIGKGVMKIRGVRKDKERNKPQYVGGGGWGRGEKAEGRGEERRW